VIFCFLSYDDIRSARVVCKCWRDFLSWESFWRKRCLAVHDVQAIEIEVTEGIKNLHPFISRWEMFFYDITQKPKESNKSFILKGIEASSQDQDSEKIGNTLKMSTKKHPKIALNFLPDYSYWGSKGEADENSNEYLIYELKAPVCFLSSFSILPFVATFQTGNPCYAPQKVQISISTSKSRDDITFTSPVFTVKQTGELQNFELENKFVYGSFLIVDLFGRTQTQLSDLLYYTCIDYLELKVRRIEHFTFKRTSNEDLYLMSYKPSGNGAKRLKITSRNVVTPTFRWNFSHTY